MSFGISDIVILVYLFRDSDEMCDELDEASSDEKFHRFKEKWDVISNASTRLLFDKVILKFMNRKMPLPLSSIFVYLGDG